jgi:hypothetical protein
MALKNRGLNGHAGFMAKYRPRLSSWAPVVAKMFHNQIVSRLAKGRGRVMKSFSHLQFSL